MQYITPAKEAIKSAYREIKDLQSGKFLPAKTRFEHFNDNLYGGMLGRQLIILGGMSGTGKSFVSQQIENDFLDEILNEQAKEHILLRCNWEMTFRSLMMREIREKIKSPIKDIYYKKPTQEEQEIIDSVFQKAASEKIYYLSKSLTPDQFEVEVREFLELHKDKKKVLVSIDHIGLVDDEGDNFRAVIELTRILNRLKQDYANVIFLVLMQLNRSLQDRTDHRHAAPKSSDLFGNDAPNQLADLTCILHRPSRLGFNEYMQVNKDQFRYLEKYFKNPNGKNPYTSFNTQNLIFWHYLKRREDDETMIDLAVQEISENVDKALNIIADEKDKAAKSSAPPVVSNKDGSQVNNGYSFRSDEDDLPF